MRTRARHPEEPGASQPAIGAADEGEVQRLLFDHISDAVWATDPANRVTHWTASAERLFGYSATEAVGRSFGELLPFRMARPGDEREFFATLGAGRTWRGTGTVRLRDGREIWIESTVQPIMAEGRLLGSVSVSRDISATVEAQRMLADRERFVTTVLDAVGAMVLVLDAQGRVVRVNSAGERLSGYPAAALIGRPIWDVAIPPAEVDDVRALVADFQSGAVPTVHHREGTYAGWWRQPGLRVASGARGASRANSAARASAAVCRAGGRGGRGSQS